MRVRSRWDHRTRLTGARLVEATIATIEDLFEGTILIVGPIWQHARHTESQPHHPTVDAVHLTGIVERQVSADLVGLRAIDFGIIIDGMLIIIIKKSSLLYGASATFAQAEQIKSHSSRHQRGRGPALLRRADHRCVSADPRPHRGRGQDVHADGIQVLHVLIGAAISITSLQQQWRFLVTGDLRNMRTLPVSAQRGYIRSLMRPSGTGSSGNDHHDASSLRPARRPLAPLTSRPNRSPDCPC